ncbi:MAG: hypothetical protein IME98_01370 [Proteobacteria bacterium]|nr:hypothetical protein [Pseudomonadota bacterium]
MARVTHVCRQCSYSGKPEMFKRGSLKIEVLLWLALIVPGIIYSVWRRIGATPICPKCHFGPMMSSKSGLGYRMSGG